MHEVQGRGVQKALATPTPTPTPTRSVVVVVTSFRSVAFRLPPFFHHRPIVLTHHSSRLSKSTLIPKKTRAPFVTPSKHLSVVSER